MTTRRRHSVALRLWLAVAALALALLALGALVAGQGVALQREAQERRAAMDAKLDAAQRWVHLTTGNVVRIEATAASGDAWVAELYKAEIASVTAEVNQVKQAIDALPLDEQDRALMETVAARRGVMLASLARLRALKPVDPAGARAELLERFRPAVGTYLQALRDFAAAQAKAKTRLQAQLDAEQARLTRRAGALLILLVLALGGGAAWLVRSIQRPLARAMAVAERVAAGDLSRPVPAEGRDEFATLLRALARMAERLRGAVGELRQGTASLSHASGEIASGNADLSMRTEQAAAHLQQTAGAMAQLGGALGQSADSAQQATGLAGRAAADAERGAAVVGQVMGKMEEISASARRIAEINAVIDGIAFQTNILALNAAVEAARAGEQGRGFAVVAGEVRALAQRSAAAAREIKALIAASSAEVQAGSALAAQSGTAMREIVAGTRRVVTLMEGIATRTGEQREGLVQVDHALGQLDRMTQANAALVEQSAAAAHSLREQAARLAGVAALFKV